MRILFFVSILFSCPYLPVYAQDDTSSLETIVEAYDAETDDGNDHILIPPDALGTTEAYKSQALTILKFDEDKWKAIVKDVDYQEQEEVAGPEKQSAAPWAGKLLKFISFVVIAGLLIAVIFYVTRFISFDFKIERTELDMVNVEAPVEDIAELDIERLLEQAKRDGNYKVAVRLYYLGLLKKLNDKGAIFWKKDKTNRDYLAELFSSNVFFDEVRILTLSYEAVWYGDHDLKPETFKSLTTRFENIYGKINTNENA